MISCDPMRLVSKLRLVLVLHLSKKFKSKPMSMIRSSIHFQLYKKHNKNGVDVIQSTNIYLSHTSLIYCRYQATYLTLTSLLVVLYSAFDIQYISNL